LINIINTVIRGKNRNLQQARFITIKDDNETIKIEDEMKFATVNSNIVKVNNLIVVNSF